MNVNSIGDLAKNLQLRRDTARIRTDLNRLTQELSSGVDSNLVNRFKGNFAPLSGIERGLARAESFLAVISEHDLVVSSAQGALSNLRTLGEISGTLLTVQDTSDPTLMINAGHDAMSRFSSVINTLNVQSGGRSVFSGVTTDRPALADAETIMTALESEIALAGAVSANDVVTVVSTWFAVGGGYDTLGYIGGAQATAGPRLSDGETAPPPITADHEAVRSYLAALAMGGLLGRDVLPGNTEEQGMLAREAGLHLIDADDQLVDLKASLGSIQGQVQRARSEVMAETEGLEIARTGLLGVDPYEAAVELQSAESQLQSLYTITARLSRLSLTGYL
ncbi:MAG: hypothetical protein HKN18_05995 [Silicimonas sp.]|nr:hypothetical protein [Silicimonas sp.]